MPWLLLDVAWICLFAFLGRENHAGNPTPLTVFSVAWPFLVGYVISAIVVNLPRSPRGIRRGALVWIGMVVIAMAIRTVELGRLPEQAFVVVALVFLGVGMFGIRLLAMFVGWRRRRKRNARIAALTEPDEL
jgi:Protein of unknown function (DUF3054)